MGEGPFTERDLSIRNSMRVRPTEARFRSHNRWKRLHASPNAVTKSTSLERSEVTRLPPCCPDWILPRFEHPRRRHERGGPEVVVPALQIWRGGRATSVRRL